MGIYVSIGGGVPLMEGGDLSNVKKKDGMS